MLVASQCECEGGSSLSSSIEKENCLSGGIISETKQGMTRRRERLFQKVLEVNVMKKTGAISK